MKRDSSPELRWILIEATRVHVNWASPHHLETRISKYYWKLRKKKPENKAIIGAARKMLQAIYWKLKNKSEFRLEG
jgi:hypothetical protein